MHRRRFLSGIAAAVPSGESVLQSGVASPFRGTRSGGQHDRGAERSRIEDAEGVVVFTYDDSPIEDYSLTYPVHQEYGVPGCLAVCPGMMEGSENFLDPRHLREMYADGWGVMSHTFRHRVLGRIPLSEPARAGDRKVYVETNRHGRFEGDPLVVFDGEARVSARVAGRGSDSTDAFVEVEEPLSDPIDASGYVRHPERFMREIVARTDDRLESWRIDVSGFVYTYGRYHGTIEGVVRDRYGAVANHRYGGGHNDVAGLDPTAMRRRYVETDKASEAEIDAFMQTAADEDVLSIVGAHSQFETFTEERLRYTIEAALEYDLAIVTIEEAIDALVWRADRSTPPRRSGSPADTTLAIQ